MSAAASALLLSSLSPLVSGPRGDRLAARPGARCGGGHAAVPAARRRAAPARSKTTASAAASATRWHSSASTPAGGLSCSSRTCRLMKTPTTMTRRSGTTTGTAGPAPTLTAAAICAAWSRTATSTRCGSGTPRACTPTITGRTGLSMNSRRRCQVGRGRPPGPDGRCGWCSSAARARTSPSVTGHCSPYCALTCTQAYLDAERCRRGTPALTPRHWELLRLVAAGHTNAQIARRLGVSEGTVRIHLQNIYARLQVSSRTAAVTRAFPDLAAT